MVSVMIKIYVWSPKKCFGGLSKKPEFFSAISKKLLLRTSADELTFGKIHNVKILK